MFLGFPPQLKHFEQRVKDTLAQAHAVSTRKAQCNAVFTLALFCMFFDVNFPKISTHTLLSFIVFLSENELAVPTIRNYVSSINTRFKVLSIPIEVFESPHLTLMFTSLSKSQIFTAPYKPPGGPIVQGKLIFVTQAELRRVLKQSLIPLNFPSGYTFHAFRRSGASLAFSAGVPFQAIQAHAMWTSEALWSYIHCDSRDLAVPRLFAQVFSGL
jgi:hypothetical protein